MRVFFLPFKLTKEFAKNKTSCYVSSQQAIEALYPSPEGKGFTANRDKTITILRPQEIIKTLQGYENLQKK